MRDPKRIDDVLDRIKVIWKSFPDLRFVQLILNSLSDDDYYLEDDKFIEKLESFYDKYGFDEDIKNTL